ncbi:MAG TPA: YjcZ family sporulation protein [Bacillaceae bacterium]
MYHGGYGCYDPCHHGYGYGVGGVRNNFALIVVLFILLIIIGACWCFPK